MDFKQLASTILANVGGKENVDKVVHCATRLRFTLKDESKARTDELKKTKGVMAVINAGGQYQVVIGPDVPAVYQEIIALCGFESAAPVEDPKATKEDNRSASSLPWWAAAWAACTWASPVSAVTLPALPDCWSCPLTSAATA